jgi:hypothetical protein
MIFKKKHILISSNCIRGTITFATKGAKMRAVVSIPLLVWPQKKRSKAVQISRMKSRQRSVVTLNICLKNPTTFWTLDGSFVVSILPRICKNFVEIAFVISILQL